MIHRRQVAEAARQPTHADDGFAVQFSSISASTGMFDFSSCLGFSTSILMRYTSFTRSSRVWICLGVNSASDAIKEMWPVVGFARIRIGGERGLRAQLHASQIGFIDVGAQPGMIQIPDAHHRGSGRQHLADFRCLHQHHAVDRRVHRRIVDLRFA